MSSESSAGVPGVTVRAGPDYPTATIVRWAAVTATVFLLLAAAALCWRRLAGALFQPLEPAVLLAVAVFVGAAAAAIRLAWRWQARDGGASRWRRWSPWAVSAGVIGVGAALSLKETSLLGLVPFWLILLGEEWWAWYARARHRRARRRAAASVGPTASAARENPLETGHEAESPVISAVSVAQGPPAGDVVQQLIRRRAADGTEVVSGWLRVALAAGQRIANLHVAFCPPLARTPQVNVEQVEGPPARIKKVQVLPYGARFDLKLAEAAEASAWVLLQFSAQSGPPTGVNAGAADRGGEVSTGE